MSHPNPTHERDNEYPEDDIQFVNDERELTAAEHWSKIIEMVEALKVQCADLDDKLKELNRSLFKV